jgi:hypothetical protein
MHDPFQTYPTVGTYPGMTTPSSLPYPAQQVFSMNPAAAFNPLAATLGAFGINPGAGIMQGGQPMGPHHIGAQQLQAAAILAAQAANPQFFGLSPWATGLHNNPLQAALLANPLIAAGLQNPFIQNPFINGGLQNPLFSVGLQNPFQTGVFGNPLAGAGLGNPFFAGIQNPALNPMYATQNPWQGGGLFGHQQHSPYSQFGHIASQLGQAGPYGQVGYPLAPQSWVGQAGPFGGGQAFGQVHPLLQQLGARPFQVPGLASWGQ